jgi:PhnB protein
MLDGWYEMPQVNPNSEGLPTVTPHLCVDGADRAIELYTQVFGAAERLRQAGPAGSVWHAELVLGDSVIIVADQSHTNLGCSVPG